MNAADTDASLLAASQAGDVHAFGYLIERHHNLVCAIAYSRTGDRIASEDLAQETFFAAWKSIGTLREPDKLRAWLCGITRNLASKSHRGRRLEDDIADHEGQLAGDAGPLDAMLSKEIETTVWSALSQLPETYREPLVLFYREEQSIKEVAVALGLSEDTAKQRLSRGRQQLKDNLGDLVEQTLHKGRPNKAAAAAVLAAIIASGARPALASAHEAGRATRWKLLTAALGVATAATLAVYVGRTASSSARVPEPTAANAIIAELRAAREASASSALPMCQLAGSVLGADGAPVATALVAIVDSAWQASSLEPHFIEPGAAPWKLAVARGTYTVSVSAPGHRAQARLVTCGSTREDVTLRLVRGDATLRGSIADTGGGPIARATIWVLDARRPDELFVTRTRPDGSYELMLERGLYTELVVHPDYTLDARPITLTDADVREDLTLLPGGSIEGIVVDDRGRPIAGAKVSTLAFQANTTTPLRWQLASFYGGLLPAVSDAEGRFVLRGLPPGPTRLVARGPTFASVTPVALELTLAENRTGVTIAAAPARSLTGFVVARGDERRGLANVRVLAMQDRAPFTMPVIATSDPTGHFELSGLPPGTYRIVAAGREHVPYVATDLIDLADGAPAETLVVLERGVAVRGRVDAHARADLSLRLAGEGGAPLERLRVSMMRAVVDERGTFTFPAVAPGRYVVTATTIDGRGETAIEVGTAPPPPVSIHLDARPMITGEVVDDQGTKLAGVLVQATPARPSDPLAAMHTTVRTDARGAFRIVGVERGRHRLRVFDARGQRAWTDEPRRPFKGRIVEAPATESLVVASGGGSLSGIVVDASGQPVMDAWIEVRARDAQRVPELFAGAPILTDAAGRFSIDRLFGTELLVEASAPDGRARAITKAAPGAQVELVLRPLTTITADVTAHGARVETFELRLRNTQTETTTSARGATGRVTFSAIAGDHELVVTSDRGYAKQPLTVGTAPPTANVAVELSPWSALRGRVIAKDGTPCANTTLIVRESVEPTLTRTDAQGAFSIERVIAGRNELSILCGSDIADFHFELQPGQHLDAGTIDASAAHSTNARTSTDLGLGFFVSPSAPTPAQIAAVARDPRAAEIEGDDPSAALWIVEVTPGGPAARAGLLPGDRIAAVGLGTVENGRGAVTMMKSLSTPWRSKGRAVTWKVVRGARELSVPVLVP